MGQGAGNLNAQQTTGVMDFLKTFGTALAGINIVLSTIGLNATPKYVFSAMLPLLTLITTVGGILLVAVCFSARGTLAELMFPARFGGPRRTTISVFMTALPFLMLIGSIVCAVKYFEVVSQMEAALRHDFHYTHESTEIIYKNAPLSDLTSMSGGMLESFLGFYFLAEAAFLLTGMHEYLNKH